MLANIREALAFHIDGLVESGDPVPVPAMSIDDVIAYHGQALADLYAASRRLRWAWHTKAKLWGGRKP